jgi:hypothetical protein
LPGRMAAEFGDCLPMSEMTTDDIENCVPIPGRGFRDGEATDAAEVTWIVVEMNKGSEFTPGLSLFALARLSPLTRIQWMLLPHLEMGK